MTIVAVLFLFCSLGLFLYRGVIGEKTFFGLSVVLMITLSVTVMGPNMLEVNIGGNTLKALRQETERAQEALSALRKLRSDMLSMEFKRIAISEDFFTVPFEAVKAEEFDQLMFVLDMLPKKEQLDEELHEDIVRACKAVLARQHIMTGLLFVFSGGEATEWGEFSRADLWPDDENFRTLTSGEIRAELDGLHRKIANTPGQSLENDKNRELRLEAVENYKHLSDVCSALAKG